MVNGISSVLQKLIKYFNGAATSTSFILPAAGVFPVILILLYYHFDLLCNIAATSWSFWIIIAIYSIKLYIGITTSIYFSLSISVLFISLMQSVNGTQFLSSSPLFLSSACLAAASATSPVTVIFFLTSTYPSQKLH